MYKVMLEESFQKEFKRLDKSVQKQVVQWIVKHIENCENPRAFGKPLAGNLAGFWRYRIGNYRLLVEINDEIVTIIAVSISHRSTVYKK